MIEIICGNNLEVLRTMEDCSVDSIVTDPPYGLSKEPDALKMLTAWINEGHFDHKGKGFMGKEWDGFVPQPIFWKECLRVLKPGGHLASFGGTRTFDLITLGLRLAGFEIRDVLSWNYGSGFPKSLDISKSIDKQKGLSREKIGEFVYPDGGKRNRNKVRVSNEKFKITSVPGLDNRDITTPTSPEAKQYDGFGTALKPACEPIILCRKPISEKNIAQNVLRWGTGGLNLKACRVETKDTWEKRETGNFGNKFLRSLSNEIHKSGDGRFPPNVLFDSHTAKLLDKQSGASSSSSSYRPPDKGGSGNTLTFKHSEGGERGHTDSGGASRFFPILDFDVEIDTPFFYEGKAQTKERNAGVGGKWFYDLELICDEYCFTGENLFITKWEELDQNQNTGLNGEAQQPKVILGDMITVVVNKEWSTLLFGKKHVELFPTAIKFTTRTGTKLIIELKTLSYYQPLTTNACMVDVIKTNMGNGLNLAENVGLKNLLKIIFTKDEMGFPRGVKPVASKMQHSISVNDAWQRSNIHSTVKPVRLMEWLVKLITPINGIVLEPYLGSGTTAVACKRLGYSCIGIELNEEYVEIAKKRVDAVPESLFDEVIEKVVKKTDEQIAIQL